MNENRRLFLTLALLNALWTPVNLMVRTATGGGMSPIAIAILRWSSLAVLLFGLLRIPWFRETTRAAWPSRGDAVRAVLVGMCLFGPAHALYYLALTRTSTIEGTVLGTTAPVWTALFAFFFLRERASPQRVGAIALGFFGAYVVSVGFQLPELRAGNTFGNAVYLGGVLAESAASVIVAPIIRRTSGITILAFQVLGASITLSLLPHLAPSIWPFAIGSGAWQPFAAVAYLVLVPGVVCFGVWYMLIERTPLSLMVLTILLQPPLSALIGWAALGERLTPTLGVGSALVLAALVLGASEHTRTRRPIPSEET